MFVITDPAQVTPEWLTDTLRRSGVLERGMVTVISSRPVPGHNSCHLTVEYSTDAPESAPRRLFLKINAPALRLGVPGLGKKEVEFYQAIAGSMADLPVPRCYDAVYSDEADCYHLLLDDLSETHMNVRASQLPPTDDHCEQIVDGLARIHAYWWDHPQLGRTVGERPTPETIRQYFAEDVKNAREFIAFLSDRLSARRQDTYERVIGGLLPLLLRRLTGGNNLTLVYEDVHIGNFLYPRDPACHRLVIVDWEQWTVYLGANDLAYMMAAFWFPERRSRLEKPLLERYLQDLKEHGVEGYEWSDLWVDYRLAVANHLFMPAWRWKHGGATDIWWNHLERLMLAFEDLKCEELLT